MAYALLIVVMVIVTLFFRRRDGRVLCAERRATPAVRQIPLRRQRVLASVVAIVVALIFFFPIYWAVSTILRNPADTFTVAGLGIPFVNFSRRSTTGPHQLSTPEGLRALAQQHHRSRSAPRCWRSLLGTARRLRAGALPLLTVPNRDITVWFLSQRVLPPVATVIPFYLMIARARPARHAPRADPGQRDLRPAVRRGDLRQTFLDLPVELEEAALVDGASYFGAFWRIALPLAAPAIAATGLIIFAFTWNEFLFAVIARQSSRRDHHAGAHRGRASTRAACSSGSWRCAR